MKTPSYTSGTHLLPRSIILVVDCLLMVGGFYLTYVMRFGLPLPQENYEALRNMIPWIALGTGAIFGSLGLYGEPHLDGSHTLTSVLVAVVLSEFVTMAGAFWFRNFALPRTVLGLALLVHWVVMSCWRQIVSRADARALMQRKYVVITNNGSDLSEIEMAFHDRLNVTGSIQASSLIGALSEREYEPPFDGAILVSVPEEEKRTLIRLLATGGKHLLVYPEPEDIMIASAEPRQVGDQSVLVVSGLGLSPGRAFIKRLMDVTIALLALIIALPILLMASITIVLSSGWPVLYRQARVGQSGRIFEISKLRTMHRDAEAQTGPVMCLDDDPRITRVGRILRALRIDELPQLLSVLAGDMSIVGPRPERPEFVEEFERRIPSYRYRLLAKPGLTGLAQVKAGYATRPEDKLLHDLVYISNYSIRLDLTIILRTLVVVLTPSLARGLPSEPKRNGSAQGPRGTSA